MTGIVEILKLVLMMSGEQSEEVRFLSELNNFFNFDHIVHLLDSSANITRFVNANFSDIPQTLFVLKTANNNNTDEFRSLTKITSKNTLMIVVPETSDFERNADLFQRVEEIQSHQINTKIGVFFSQPTAREELRKLFQWCKEHLIINIFAATKSFHKSSSHGRQLNIFSFHPFGTFDVIEVTSDKNILPSLNSNFRQHAIQITPQFDRKTDRSLWLIVFRLMNATFVEIKNDSTERLENGIEIVPRLYAQEKATDVNDPFVYPLTMTPIVVIVPEPASYSEFLAYLLTATSNALFGLILFTIAVVMLSLCMFRYIKQKKMLFFRSVTDVLNLLLNDNGYIRYQKLSQIEIYVIIPLTFLGFVIANGFLSNLQSYFTRPILKPAIFTLEEIYRSPFPILTWSEDWKKELNNVFANRTNIQDWTDKISVVDDRSYLDQIRMYNRSISFVIDKKYGDMLLKLQKFTNTKGYHNPQITIANFLFTYKLKKNFLFFERLNEIIHRIHSSGLYDLFLQREDRDSQYKIVKKNFKHLISSDESDAEGFEFPMWVVYGWVVSGIVFVIEISCEHIKFASVKQSVCDVFWKIVRSLCNTVKGLIKYFSKLAREAWYRSERRTSNPV